MKRTFFLTAVSLIFSALLLAGPASAASDLVVAVDSPPRMMNPHGDDSDANLSFMANFFDGLLQRVGPDAKLAPALAVRWEHPSMLTWKFYLRKGVTFHNGNPFTAADVKFSFERLRNPEVSEFLNTGKQIEKMDIIDDYTILITTKTPLPWFANMIHQVSIMDQESTESRDAGDVNVRPIGTGAYKFEEWIRGSYVRMTANEAYWEGAPPLKSIEVRPIKEASTRFAALVSGRAEIVTGVPVELYERVLKNPKLDVIRRAARRSIFLGMGNKVGSPLADIRVRKAIYMAINEAEIIEKIMRGHATPAAQIPDPPTIGYNAALKRLPYDPAKAKQLLADAGYGDGFEVKLTGPNDRYVQDEKILEAVAKYLAKVDIKVKLDVKPKSIFFPQVAEGSLEFFMLGWFDGSFDMARTYFKLAHTRNSDKGFGGLNGASFSNVELDKLLETTADIVDSAQRKLTIEKVNQMAMEELITFIPLHYQVDLYAIQKGKNIKFQPRPDRWMVYKEISK